MNKRGVSEIVSYVLLVVIALVISSLVFAFLKIYVPKEKPECKEGINVVIESYVCKASDHSLSLTVQNRGLFETNAIYVRVGVDREKFKKWINDPKNNEEWGFDLNPGREKEMSLKIPSEIVDPSETYILEIQPAIVDKKDIDFVALCPPISQTITCT